MAKDRYLEGTGADGRTRGGKEIPDDSELIEELTEAVKFSKYSLDDDLVSQPTLYQTVSSLHVQAKSHVKQLKVEIEIAEAELYLQFRKAAEEENGNDDEEEKPKKGKGKRKTFTETTLKMQVITSTRMQQLSRKLVKAETRADILEALERSYIQRSHSLRGEIELYVANYFQTETSGKRRHEATEEIADRNRKATGKLRRERRERLED